MSRRRTKSAGGVQTLSRRADSGGTTPAWGNTSGLYATPSESTQRGWRPQLDRDAAYLISRYKRRAMLSDARHVYATIGQVSGAVHDKADFAVGQAWIPQYNGTNERFKRAFSEIILGRWLRNCDVRGAPYDFQTNVWRSSVATDRDGEVFILLTSSERGSPRLQFLESHRIGGPAWGEVVPDGVPREFQQYVGRDIYDGVVVDEQLRPLAYNILPGDSLFLNANQWNLVPASSVIHVYDPTWFSQVRGVPTLCNGILDWYDLGEIRDAEKTGVKANARIILTETNDTGRGDPGKQVMAARSTGSTDGIDPRLRVIENGLIWYAKAGTGQKIESHKGDRPGNNFLPFNDHIARSAHRGMDWPIEMHDWSKVGGAAVRAVGGQVQRSCARRQGALWNPMLSAVLYAVSSYMNRREMPFADDWMNIGFSLPPKFSVDLGRDGQNRRQDVAMGLRGLDDVLLEEGEGDYRAVLERRAQVRVAANEISAKYGLKSEDVYNPGAASSQAAQIELQQDQKTE